MQRRRNEARKSSASERDERCSHRVVVNNSELYLPQGLLRGQFSAYGRVVVGSSAVVTCGGGQVDEELGRIGSMTQHDKIDPKQCTALGI